MRNLILMLISIGLIIGGCAKINKPDVENGEKILEINQIYPTTGYARDICVSDNMIYIAQDETGIAIFDRTSGELMDENSDSKARYITISEQDSFMVSYDGQDFHVYCFSDIDSIFEIGYSFKDDYSRNPNLIEVNTSKDTFAMSFIKSSELRIKRYKLDLTFDFWEVIVDNKLDFPNRPLKDYRIKEEYIYLSASQFGLIVSDTTNQILGTADTPGEALALEVVGDYVYIADKHEGLQVIDISDKENPELIFSYDTQGWAQSVDAQGNYLVVGSGGGGVYLFDITDLSRPKFLDRLDDDIVGYTYKAVISNGEVFVASKTGVFRLVINE